MESLTISLAGKSYTIQPLTIGQLAELHIGVMKPMPANEEEGGPAFWKQQIGILAAALSEDHPDMTAEVIRKLRVGTFQELKKQCNAILKFSGLIAPVTSEEKPTGEAPAGTA